MNQIPKSPDFPQFDAWQDVPTVDADGNFAGMTRAWLDPGETRLTGKAVYPLPPNAVSDEAPSHDEDNDRVKYIGGKWQVQVGALKAERDDADAKAKADAAAAAKAQADADKAAADAQAKRYADGIKAGFTAAQVTYLMNGYTPPAK